MPSLQLPLAMSSINNDKDLFGLTEHNIQLANFDELLHYFSRSGSYRALICILLYVRHFSKTAAAKYGARWMVQNIGRPIHYEGDPLRCGSLCFRSGQVVVIVEFVDGLFKSFSTTSFARFVSDEVEEVAFEDWRPAEPDCTE